MIDRFSKAAPKLKAVADLIASRDLNTLDVCRRLSRVEPPTTVRLWVGILAGIVLMLSAGSASARWRLDFAPEYFYWQEDYNDTKILDESGFRIGFEATYEQPRTNGWLMAARLRAYYGSVDYDGALQDGTPFQTTTEYYGALLEGRYGYRAGLGTTYYLDLMGSVGIDFWLRSVDPGGAAGVNEYWLPFYCKAGLEVSPSAEKGWVAALGIKLPFYTLETVDVGGDVYTLNPKPRVSPYAEAGYQFTRSLSARAFFDSYWFGESDLDSSGTVFQPESKSYQVGAKLGWSF